jgi:hypothetical protein
MADEQPRERSSTTAIFDRINTIEREFAETRSQMTGITVTLTGLQSSLSRIQQMVEARSATDWKALASWATVILAVVGGFVTLVLGPVRAQIDAQAASINRFNEIRLADLREKNEDHKRELELAEQRGRTLERMDELVRRVDRLTDKAPTQ